MLAKISQFFDQLTKSESESGQSIDQELAIAALLIEMANSDGSSSEREINVIAQLLVKLFGVAKADVDALVERAKQSNDDSVCLYRYTSIVKQAPVELRNQVVLALWKVSYADGVLDPYEEATIRKVADLLYVSHSDYVRNKLQAQAIMGIA
ncbi:TerB family tellurite resistance protein [Neiella marina]|uniref:TerB family tellurite resistance protein n=1 Tax=Neiella holothuriorum TaxID=2870530 RepID=A0ABS7EGQ7_9GAMM|nr:TerB family tellurite resistance protein [Neiella holothuriorum]MBW8191523.1 TerB family tellurite resistance protein [Neiella holothuriorum]